MRIGFDAKRAVQNFTGLGNYSRFVIESLAEQNHSDEYYLYSPKPPSNPLSFFKKSTIHFRHPGKTQSKTYWRSKGIIADLKRDGIDVFHGLSNELPLGIKKTKIKSVVTIHDLIFLRYPRYYPWFDRIIYKLKFRYACKNADMIIAISNQTKQDIISFFGTPADRIEVVYQDCNDSFKPYYSDEEKQQVGEKYHLPKKFLLNVGTIEARKNLLLIAKALKTLPESISLVVVGKETAYTAGVKKYLDENNLTNRVLFLKNVAYSDLPLIYQQAEIFIYPSRFEGFGIPVVEALHSGVPVIAATGSCLEEAGGPQSIYVNPDDEVELSRAINLLITNPDKKKDMVQAGREHVKQFSKATIAEKLKNIYNNLRDA